MEPESQIIICIEFIYSEECPYCPLVKNMLLELLDSKIVGDHLIIEEIDINSSIGKERALKYNLKGVPAIALNGKLKFQGVPSPTLLFGEVNKLVSGSKSLKPPVQQKSHCLNPPDISKKSDTDLSFYT